MQLVELREYAARRGWHVVEEYIDHGVSGAKESRPALNRLMADAKQRRFDMVAVWKIDRFGRSLRHLVNSLADLESLGVSFVSLRDSIDLSSPSGVLMFQLIAAMSQFERSLLQERVRAGIRNAQNKGRRLGRPRLELDQGRIVRLRANGATRRKACCFSCACRVCRPAQYSLSTGVSTVIRDALLSAVCEISIETGLSEDIL